MRKTSKEGGLTEATGDLAPDGRDEEFVPAERKELEDPDAARQVTAAAHRRRKARRAAADDDPGHLIQHDQAIRPNDRDGGYGSEHGLSGDDPAYLEETHMPSAGPRPEGHGPGSEMGVDERVDPREDRL